MDKIRKVIRFEERKRVLKGLERSEIMLIDRWIQVEKEKDLGNDIHQSRSLDQNRGEKVGDKKREL